MKTIWKFPIPVTDHCVVSMPRYYTFLAAHSTFRDIIDIWAQVTLDNKTNEPLGGYVDQPFVVVGTGNPIPSSAKKYLATVQAPPFVWHLFLAHDKENEFIYSEDPRPNGSG